MANIDLYFVFSNHMCRWSCQTLCPSHNAFALSAISLSSPPPLQTTKAFLPRMLELCHGHVVCINSILSLASIPGAIDYCTSKASSLAFMESLTLGLLDCPGVACTTILPFHTNTDMFQGMKVRWVFYLRLYIPDSLSCYF